MNQNQKNNHLISRIDYLRKTLALHNIDAAFISKKESISYFTNLHSLHPLEREAYLLISPQKIILYHSPFIDISSNPLDHIHYILMSPLKPLSQIMTDTFNSSITSVGIETTNMTVSEYQRTMTTLPDKNLEPIDQLISNQKLIKDKSEQQLMFTAGKIAANAIDWCQSFLNQKDAIGITEQNVSYMLSAKMRQLGADDKAFPTIVAFDKNSAKPHHRPDDTMLKKNSIILIDMGADYHQYKSDLTRTWKRSGQQALFNQIEKIVSTAYEQAVITASTPKVTASKIDQTARNIILKAGYAKQFIHSTGHGIGGEAHEIPHITISDITPIIPGISFTIEPGIYLPNRFGYRHENTFIMTPAGPISTTS